MFNILTVICMQYSEWICCKFNSILKLNRNLADKTSFLKYTHGTLHKQRFALIEKKLFNDEERKQERKVKQNHYTWQCKWQDLNPRNFRTNKVTAETTKQLEIKNLPTLRNDSLLVVQFNNS